MLGGGIVDPGQYRDDTRKLVARARRETNSTTTTTETDVLRIDGLKVFAGRYYLISTTQLQVQSTVLNDVVTARVRHTTDGSTATTTSAQIGQMTADHNIAAGKGASLLTELTPAIDQTVSLVLTVGRTAGTGAVSLEGNPVYPLCLWVFDMGPDTGNVGISL